MTTPNNTMVFYPVDKKRAINSNKMFNTVTFSTLNDTFLYMLQMMHVNTCTLIPYFLRDINQQTIIREGK